MESPCLLVVPLDWVLALSQDGQGPLEPHEYTVQRAPTETATFAQYPFAKNGHHKLALRE